MHTITPAMFANTVEKLLYEQLEKLGEHPESIPPHIIKENMFCKVFPDDSMQYSWKGFPILRIIKEQNGDKSHWHIFTADDDPLLPS